MEKNKKIGSMLLYCLKLTVKWLWLFIMFLLGLVEFAALPLEIFEYSYSLSELDFMETLFVAYLVVFIYHYVKLCRRVRAPLIRKIITPWVHQAHLFLLFILGTLIAVKWFDFKWDDYPKTPMLDAIATVMMMLAMVYSYVRLSRYSLKPSEKVNSSDIENSGVAQ